MENVNFKSFPVLNTSRLILRKVEKDDYMEIFFLRSDNHILKYLVMPPCESVDEARGFIEKVNAGMKNKEWIFWAITLKGSNKVTGMICLWNFLVVHFRAEVGYVLHPESQGKGYMKEALQEVLKFGYQNLKLHTIAGVVSPDNKRSVKLLEGMKFEKEAHFKENCYFNGKFTDTCIYSLINRNFLF